MISYSFQQEGETGLLRLIDHFGKDQLITVYKNSVEQFRTSLTAINYIEYKKAVVESIWDSFLTVIDQDNNYVKAYYTSPFFTSGESIYIYESFNTYIPWIASKELIKNPEILYVNIEILQADQIHKQFKINTYTGESKIIDVF